jgi:hypothetical protein
MIALGAKQAVTQKSSHHGVVPAPARENLL